MTATQKVISAYAGLPEKQKASVAAWIKADRLSHDPAYLGELARRNRAMDTRRTWSLPEARKLSRQLGRRGL